ncbi:MAG: 16S rRNA (guanine(527)-N(7))-methyltransferase RsmG [Gammaproteobacteria bacterium]
MFDTNITPLNISKKNEEKITTFIDLALEFNKTHNIFVRKNAKEVFEKDIVDCLPLTSEILDKESVLDLGSGGGFPGILIGILKPNNKVCLVESSSKKCYFLKKTVHELSLKNVFIINSTISKNNNIGKYDIITARAFANTEKIINITKNNTKPSTKYLLLKGTIKKLKEELEVLNTKQLTYEIIKLDNKKAERHLVKINQNE